MSNDPSQAIPAVNAMREDWRIIAPLMGGTKAMRAAGKALLPQFPAEEDEVYKQRLALSTLLPAYSETIENNTSRVFAEPLQLGDDVPDGVRELCDDIDLAGNSLANWAVEWFRFGLTFGLCHVLIDHPQAEGLRTKADEAAAGVRPYGVIIKPEQVLGWREEGGRLAQVRYMESVEEADGEFGTKVIEQIRVLEPGLWQTYRKPEDSKVWVLHEEGLTSLPYIPWVTFYTGRTGFMTARPPLIELAYLNVKHWQSQSDQDNLLHVARVPLLFVFTDDDEFELKISAASATRMPKDGKAEYVEHTGAAIEAGRTSLQDLIDEMRMTGAKLVQRDKQTTKTATQAQEEASQELSPLSRMASQFADCVAQMLQIMADYRGLPDGGMIEMRGNFDADFMPEVSLPTLVSMASAGMLSKETLFTEMQRRGVIADEYDWADEIEKIDSQGPSLGVM